MARPGEEPKTGRLLPVPGPRSAGSGTRSTMPPLPNPCSFTRLTKGPLPDLIGSVTGEFVGSSGPAGEGSDQR